MLINFDDSEASRREQPSAQNIMAFNSPSCDLPALVVSFHLVSGVACPCVIGRNRTLGDVGYPVPLRSRNPWRAPVPAATRGRGEQ